MPQCRSKSDTSSAWSDRNINQDFPSLWLPGCYSLLQIICYRVSADPLLQAALPVLPLSALLILSFTLSSLVLLQPRSLHLDGHHKSCGSRVGEWFGLVSTWKVVLSFCCLPGITYKLHILELVPFVISKAHVSVLPLIWFFVFFFLCNSIFLEISLFSFCLGSHLVWSLCMGLLSLLRSFYVCGKVVHLEDSWITLKDMFTKSLWNDE